MFDWKIDLAKKRKKHQEMLNKARSEFMKGENNPRWNGGNSKYPDHAEFKRARIEVLKRSKGKCEICGKPADLVHHIDEDKSNHSLDNLIASCFDCHEPLHRNSDGISVKGKPTKYGLKYGMSLREIAKIFEVCPSTIYYWLKNPEKKRWVEEKINRIKGGSLNSFAVKAKCLPVLK